MMRIKWRQCLALVLALLLVLLGLDILYRSRHIRVLSVLMYHTGNLN